LLIAYRLLPFGTNTVRTGGRPRFLPSTTACRSPSRPRECTWVRWPCRSICTVPVLCRSFLRNCWTSTGTLWPADRRPLRTARPCSRPETRRSPAHDPSCSPERLQHHRNDQRNTIEFRFVRDACVFHHWVQNGHSCFSCRTRCTRETIQFSMDGVKSVFLTLLTGLFINRINCFRNNLYYYYYYYFRGLGKKLDVCQKTMNY